MDIPSASAIVMFYASVALLEWESSRAEKSLTLFDTICALH